MSNTRHCGTCEKPENFPADRESELRPYGPGGSLICARCAFATPETEQQVGAAFGALLDAGQAMSPTGTTLLTEHGPVAIDGEMIEAEIASELTRRAETRSLIDLIGPFNGPCGICGDPDARHRLADAIAEQVRAGDSPESVAHDYGLPVSSVALLAEHWNLNPSSGQSGLGSSL